MVLLAETQDQLTALEQFFQKVIDWATTAGIKIVIALILWFIFFKLINFLNKRITKKLLKKKTDKTLTKVVNYVITVGLKILVVICLHRNNKYISSISICWCWCRHGIKWSFIKFCWRTTYNSYKTFQSR